MGCGCGGSCSCGGSCGCGGSCNCGGDCACGSGAETQQQAAHPHTFCITCGQEHASRQAVFQHAEEAHDSPEQRFCPVCGAAADEHVDDDTDARRAWLQRHLASGDGAHQQFLQGQPAAHPGM